MKRMFKVMDQHAASREVAEVKENGEILRRMLEILLEFCPRFCPTNLPEVPHLGRLLPNFCEKGCGIALMQIQHFFGATILHLLHLDVQNIVFWGIDSPENVYRQMFTRCLQTNVHPMFADKCFPDLKANSQSPPLSSLLLAGSY